MITNSNRKNESALDNDFAQIYDECENRGSLCESLNCNCSRTQRHKWLERQILAHFEPGTYYSLTICLDKDECNLYDILDFDVLKSAKHIIKRLNSLRISGFRGVFFLDVEHEKQIKEGKTVDAKWRIHWYGLIKASVAEHELKYRVYKEFGKGRGFIPAWIEYVAKRPYKYDYPLKYVSEHKQWNRFLPYGRSKKFKYVRGFELKLLEEFYCNRHLDDCVFCVGFRRNSSTLVRIIRKYDKRLVRFERKKKAARAIK